MFLTHKKPTKNHDVSNTYPLRVSGLQQKGFSLVEVMVSVFLVSIGLMSMITLQTRSVNMTMEAYTETQSVLLSQEITEHLSSNKEAAIDGSYNISLTSFDDLSIDRNTVVGDDLYDWFSNLNAVLPGARASISCDVDSNCEIQLENSVSGSTKTHTLAVIL